MKNVSILERQALPLFCRKILSSLKFNPNPDSYSKTNLKSNPKTIFPLTLENKKEKRRNIIFHLMLLLLGSIFF